MPFVSRSNIAMRNAGHHAALLARHMAEHDLAVRETGAETILDVFGGEAALRADDAQLRIVATAHTLQALEDQKYFLASHLGELVTDQDIDIAWDGDGAARAWLPNFRAMRVVGVKELTPHMRRITLSGNDLARFETTDNLHVKLYIPRGRTAPEWPSLARNGRIEWPRGDASLTGRKYTIRRVDVAAGLVDIDFVVHGDSGPGTAFARRAAPGDEVGMMGPGGLGLRAADWYLLAGDETALPAIARILENLPPSAEAVVRIEVSDRHERQKLESAAGMDIVWLERDGAAPGVRLVEAVRSVRWPSDTRDTFAWAGCEHGAFKAIRSYLRKERGLARDRHLVVAYWRRDEPAHRSASMADGA